MAEPISHDEVAELYARSGAINFEAAGKFVSEIGAELVQRDEGLHGLVFGKFSHLACFFPGPLPFEKIFEGLAGGQLRETLQVTERFEQ